MLVTLIGTTRPAFLLLPLAIVAMVSALAWYNGVSWSGLQVGMLALGAVAANAAVNVLNEVHDARTGLDERTQRTPFSGGSGSLQKQPQHLAAAHVFGLALVVLVMAVGLFFIQLRGWSLLPIGLLGLVVVMAYTPAITRSPWLCLIAPGLGFGPLMVLGGYFALTGSYSWLVLACSLVPFFLVNNLLLLNQFPDLEADRSVGRNNLIMARGPETALLVFNLFQLAALLTLLGLVVLGYLPGMALLGLAGFIPALLLYRGLQRVKPSDPLNQRLLALNVQTNLLVPFTLALGLALA